MSLPLLGAGPQMPGAGAAAPDFQMAAPLRFYGASNIQGNQDGTGVTVVTEVQAEPGLLNPADIHNEGIGGKSMDSEDILDAIAAHPGDFAAFQVAGSNDTSFDPDARLLAMQAQIDELSHSDFLISSAVPAATGFRNTAIPDYPVKTLRFWDLLQEEYPGRCAIGNYMVPLPAIFPNVDGSGNVVADDGTALAARANCVLPPSLLTDASHQNRWGYVHQAVAIQRPEMLAFSSFHFPHLPVGQRTYTTGGKAAADEIELACWSPFGDALDDCTLQVLATGGMDSHFTAIVDKAAGKVKLKRLTTGMPGGQSISDVWLRVTKWGKHYDTMQTILLGEPGAFGRTRITNGMIYGYEPFAGSDGRKGTFIVQYVPPPTGVASRLCGHGLGGLALAIDASAGGRVNLNDATGTKLLGSDYLGGFNDDPDSPSGISVLAVSVDLDAGGSNAALLRYRILRPGKATQLGTVTATVSGGDVVAVGGLRRLLFNNSASSGVADWHLGVVWACRDALDISDDSVLGQFVDVSTRAVSTGSGALGASGNSTGAVTVGDTTYTPVTYRGYGNAADWLANKDWGAGVSGHAGRGWLFAMPGAVRDTGYAAAS